jgi:hypothetical protein
MGHSQVTIIESLHRAQRGDAQKERERMKTLAEHFAPVIAEARKVGIGASVDGTTFALPPFCCATCLHETSRHDPEDGSCDAFNERIGGVCPCGRKSDEEFERLAQMTYGGRTSYGLDWAIAGKMLAEARRARASEAALREENDRLRKVLEEVRDYRGCSSTRASREMAALAALALKPSEGRDE